MNDPKQAELLEQFLTRLRADVHAEAPPGLDPDLAAFARKLAARPAADDALRARVWQRALTAAQLDPSRRASLNGRAPSDPTLLKEPSTMIATRANPSRRSSPLFTLMAAALAVAVFAVYLFAIRPNGTRGGNPAAGGASMTPSAAWTATLIPTASPTWTPSPMDFIAPIPLTPTMVPAGFDGSATVEPPQASATWIPDVPATASPTWLPELLASPTWTETPTITPSNTWTPEPSPTIYDPFADAAAGHAQAIIPGQPVEGALSPQAPVVFYHFVTQTSGLMVMHVESATIFDLDVSMRFSTATGGGGGGGGGSSPQPLQQFNTMTFIKAGTDVLLRIASATGQNTGTFTLALTLDEPIPLGADGSFENDLNARIPAVTYRFEAHEGEAISARVEGRDGFDTQLQLSDANATMGITDDDSGEGYNPELYNWVAPTTGTYYLAVMAYNGPYGASGHFKLTLTRPAERSLNAGAQTIAFNSKLPQPLTYDGHAGETLQLAVRVPKDATAYTIQSLDISVVQNGETITIFNRGDGRQPAARGSAGGVTLLAGPVTIPADGPVTITVNATGSLNQSDGLRLDVSAEKQ